MSTSTVLDYCRIHRNRPTFFLEIKFIVTDCQFGFRNNRSKTDAISNMMEELYTNSNTRKATQGVFLEFFKGSRVPSTTKISVKLKI